MTVIAFVESWHFHWKWWEPKDCIGGPVRFGWWAVTKEIVGGDRHDLSAGQVAVRRSMGWMR